ncbi:unnamed protein product [Moneuplotes crassus]|uniref:Uncharacterized protein n=1 Tax=Euplotes crassus TaxID=5936 RepID=A0AAD1UUX0_EUPCR|nr:unnamed protein product [Moneuplotes crassus]
MEFCEEEKFLWELEQDEQDMVDNKNANMTKKVKKIRDSFKTKRSKRYTNPKTRISRLKLIPESPKKQKKLSLKKKASLEARCRYFMLKKYICTPFTHWRTLYIYKTKYQPQKLHWHLMNLKCTLVRPAFNKIRKAFKENPTQNSHMNLDLGLSLSKIENTEENRDVKSARKKTNIKQLLSPPKTPKRPHGVLTRKEIKSVLSEFKKKKKAKQRLHY